MLNSRESVRAVTEAARTWRSLLLWPVGSSMCGGDDLILGKERWSRQSSGVLAKPYEEFFPAASITNVAI